MFSKMKSIWNMKELRDKLLFTVMILLLFRFGCAMPVPFVSGTALEAMFNNGSMLTYFNMISGGALSQCAVFALGVSPYINASIIMQLLCVAIPKLEQLNKDSEGRKQVENYTRICGLVMAVAMSVGYYFILRNYGALKYMNGAGAVFAAFVIISVFVAGSQLAVWMGGQIDAHGVGNGVSLLIFAGIVSRWSDVYTICATAWSRVQAGAWWYFLVALGVFAFLLASIWYVVYVSGSERRIPVVYSAKKGRSRNVNSYIPLKLVMSGVMPVIFASTMLSIPATIAMFIDAEKHPGLHGALAGFTASNSVVYLLLYVALIFCFNYFYIAIQYDPVTMANNLRNRGGAIRGIRPGKPTSDLISRGMKQVALTGSVALSLIACAPIFMGQVTGMAVQMGGTSLLIVVSVVTELMASVDSYLTVRHHHGFLA